eukprot:gene23542-biopygen22319
MVAWQRPVRCAAHSLLHTARVQRFHYCGRIAGIFASKVSVMIKSNVPASKCSSPTRHGAGCEAFSTPLQSRPRFPVFPTTSARWRAARARCVCCHPSKRGLPRQNLCRQKWHCRVRSASAAVSPSAVCEACAPHHGAVRWTAPHRRPGRTVRIGPHLFEDIELSVSPSSRFCSGTHCEGTWQRIPVSSGGCVRGGVGGGIAGGRGGRRARGGG